jgi:hypothetical protein
MNGTSSHGTAIVEGGMAMLPLEGAEHGDGADVVLGARHAWGEVTQALRAVDSRSCLLLVLVEYDVTIAQLAERLGRADGLEARSTTRPSARPAASYFRPAA